MFARPVTALAAVALFAGCAGDGPVVYTDDVVPSPTTVPDSTTVPGTAPVVVEQFAPPAFPTRRGTSDPARADTPPGTVELPNGRR